jgi:hypothetical protein
LERDGTTHGTYSQKADQTALEESTAQPNDGYNIKTKNSISERHRDHWKIQLQTYINKLNMGVGVDNKK